MITGAIILLSVIIGLTYFYFKSKYQYWEDRGVPFIQPKFPHGNMQGTKRKLHSSELFTKFYNELKGKGPFGGIYFFTSSLAFATDLNFIKTILVKDFQYFQDRGMYYNEKDDPLSAHLVAIEGDKWKTLRAKLTPTFSSAKLKMMVPTILDVAEHFKTTVWNAIEKSSEIEIKDLFARFTTDIIGSCAFGLGCNCLNDPSAEFLKMGQQVFSNQRISYVTQLIMRMAPNIARKLGIKSISEDVSDFYMKVVKDVIDHREQNKTVRHDFMNLLLELKNSGQMTFNEIAAEAFVFIVAGYETSSTLMTYCIYELAQNPDIQEKARQHISDVTNNNHGGKISYESVADMHYLEQCINEALRKYPPGSMLVRKCNTEYPVPDTNFIIEKGKSVMISVYAIHHDPEYYPSPETFDPDRFSPSEVEKRHPFAFLPFGAGPRNCIGLRFAMLEIKIGLATLLTNFKFIKNEKTPNPLVFSKTNLILTADGGVYVNVEKI